MRPPPFSMVHFWCVCACFRRFYTQVSLGNLTGLWLCSLICNRLHFVFWHLAIGTSIYSSFAIGLDKTAHPFLTMCINEPWPCHRLEIFLPCTILGRSWSLQTKNIPQELQLFWPSHLAIPVRFCESHGNLYGFCLLSTSTSGTKSFLLPNISRLLPCSVVTRYLFDKKCVFGKVMMRWSDHA